MGEIHELSVIPCAFTAPFLAWHGEQAEADRLRYAGHILFADHTATAPRDLGEPSDAAAVRLEAVIEELSALSDWLLAGEKLVEDLAEEGDVQAAYLNRVMAEAGRHLAALTAVLDQVGWKREDAARRWAATRTPGPIGAYQDWLASMAAVMRRWAPETRRRGEALVPLLPDPDTRQQMREEDRLSYPLELYDAVEIFTGHVLAEAIGDLELHATARGRVPGAGEDPDYERVWREIDPKAFEEVDR